MRSEYKWGEVLHTLSSEVTCPRGYKTQIDGSINLDSAHFFVTSSLQYERTKYATRFAYDLEEGHTSSSFDLLLPSRHIVAEAEVTSRSNAIGAAASVKWDADRDLSRKVMFDALLTMDGGQHAGALQFVCPGSEVSAQLQQEVTETTLTHHSEFTLNKYTNVVADVTMICNDDSFDADNGASLRIAISLS